MTDETSDIPSDKKMLVSDYFVFETTAIEWLMVLQNLIKKNPDPEPSDVLLVPPKDGMTSPTYMLKKSRFPAEMIAKAIGTTPEKVNAATVIRLKPFEKPEGLPEPTVGYFGTA